MADFFTGLMGGVMGAVAAVPVPAEGERQPRLAPGTDWSICCQKLHDTARELDGFVEQLTFIVGKVACVVRAGAECLSRSVAEGKVCTPGSLMDKSDVDQGIDAGRQGVCYLIRGGRLALEALVEGAKVAATRALIAAEGGKEIVLRNLPYTQQRLSQAYSSFLRGYQSGGRSLGGGGGGGGFFSSYGQSSYGQPSYGQSSYGQPSYHQEQQQPQQQQHPSGGYGAPQQQQQQQQQPPQSSGGGFFW